MFSLRPPSDLALAAFRLRHLRQPFMYAPVGCTRTNVPPAGFDADRYRVCLGRGPEVFAAACDVIRNWQQFPAGWVRVDPPRSPVAEGAVVAVVARVFGVWVRNCCRVVYVIDEPGARFGFAYGTLPGHVEAGEERFLVETAADGSVWYEITAHSRPRHRLARLGYPLARRLQRRFGRDSLRQVKRLVERAAVAEATASGRA